MPSRDLLAEASLFLDLDGTIVEIASRPDAVVVDDRLRSLLARLSLRLAGRIAIVSGRPAAQVRSFFPDVSLAIAGSHGIEIWLPDGRIISPAEPAPKAPLMERIAAFEREHPGVLVERKPFGVALHYRLAPGEEQACRQFAADAAQAWGYALQSGKKVIELKLEATDKGHAVERLMGMAPMRGTRSNVSSYLTTDRLAALSEGQRPVRRCRRVRGRDHGSDRAGAGLSLRSCTSHDT